MKTVEEAVNRHMAVTKTALYELRGALGGTPEKVYKNLINLGCMEEDAQVVEELLVMEREAFDELIEASKVPQGNQVSPEPSP